MSLWNDFLHFITFRPIPLSDSWKKIEANCLTDDNKAPVNLVNITFDPPKEVLRKFISPGFLEIKFKEITDILIYYSSEDARDSLGYTSLLDEDLRYFGELTVIWHPEKGGKKGGLQLKMAEDVEEPLEFTLKQTIESILKPLNNRKEVGFTLEYRLSAAHPEWQPPEKFKELLF